MRFRAQRGSPDDDIGLADNDIDGFLRDIVGAITRELPQNSNDEAADPPAPVVMSFDQLEVPSSSIPGLGEYLDTLRKCLNRAKENQEATPTEFFKNAIELLSRPKIRILTVSDSGTFGAGGEFKKGGRFFTLLVSKGVTAKQHLHSAGSFGIGKNSALAGSESRLVFYSSVHSNGPETRFYAMGKSVLTTWENEAGQVMSNRVFFDGGNDESASLTPETDQAKVPNWLRRNTNGLTVAIVAPKEKLRSNWQDNFTARLISNFFVAINDGRIEFKLDDGKVLINKASLPALTKRTAIKTIAEESDVAGFDVAKVWADPNKDLEKYSKDIEVKNFGTLNITLFVGEELPKKVIFVRNGMYITDTLSEFGKTLKYRSTLPFLAVVQPVSIDDDSSTNIKRMENPEHNTITTSFISGDDEIERLRKAILSLESEIRAFIKKHASFEATEETDIDELKKFFPQRTGDSSEGDKEPDPLGEPLVSIDTHEGKTRKQFKKKGDRGKRRPYGKKKTNNKKKRKKTMPGDGSEGGFSPLPSRIWAAKSDSGAWTVLLPELSAGTVIRLTPQQLSRGSEVNQPTISSCDFQGSTITSDGAQVSLVITDGAATSTEIELSAACEVVDFLPEIKIPGGEK